MVLLRWLSGKESTCHCRRCRFDLWGGKTPWGRKWDPIPVFFPGQTNLVGYSPWGHKRVGHDLTINTTATTKEKHVSPHIFRQQKKVQNYGGHRKGGVKVCSQSLEKPSLPFLYCLENLSCSGWWFISCPWVRRFLWWSCRLSLLIWSTSLRFLRVGNVITVVLRFCLTILSTNGHAV